MQKRLIGLALIFFGLGMLAAQFIPWWSVVAALAMIFLGILLLIKKC